MLLCGLGYGYYYINHNNAKPIANKKTTTVAECMALSKDVRINENTKKCFDNLSFEEFSSLISPQNKTALDLYNEVEAHYDTRTDAQKQSDADFWNKLDK